MATKKTPAIERFWKHTVRTRTGCVLWTGYISKYRGKSGYPRFNDGNAPAQSGHRWIWEQIKGAIPLYHQLKHSCPNRHCVEIKHMFLAKVGGPKPLPAPEPEDPLAWKPSTELVAFLQHEYQAFWRDFKGYGARGDYVVFE